MSEPKKMICPDCGVGMNHHATKVDYAAADDTETIDPEAGGRLVEAHTCPQCGQTATRPADE